MTQGHSSGFAASLLRLVRRDRERLALDYLMTQADPSAPLPDRVTWLIEFVRWVRAQELPPAAATGNTPGEAMAREAEPTDRVVRLRVARARFLLQFLDHHPAKREAVAKTLRSVLRDTHGLRLFALTGLAHEYGFWGEAARRLTAKLLPEPPVYADLAQVFHVLFPHARDAHMPLALPPEIYARLGELMRYGEDSNETCWSVARAEIDDAVVVLSSQVAAIGVSEAIRRRAGTGTLGHSPFIALGGIANRYLAAARQGDEPSTAAARLAMAEGLRHCRSALDDVMAHLEEHGVSVRLVYQVELARQQLARIEELVALSAGEPAALERVGRFFARLVRDMHAQRSLRALFRSNLDLLTRKIAERTGKTGEHYITRDRAEYADMLRSAARGGALTGLTVFGKFGLGGIGFAPFFEGLAASLNYATSFCVIQLVHGTLATKQPAMTAATMAARLKTARHHGRLREFVDEVANLTRSQVAAILGNLVLVVPAALLIEWAWRFAGGSPVPDPTKAGATIESLDIWGPTPFFAIYTGVLLWFSAVLSGLFENWATYRRLPEALAHQPRLVFAFGSGRMQCAGTWFARNMAALAGSIALGFLLGMTPVIAGFFGLPLDVRHVTLATGSLALAVSVLGAHALATAAFWLACAGIAVIGFLNLSVSFSLALWVAIRATGADRLSRRRLLRAVAARFFASPRDFLLPPRVKIIGVVCGSKKG